MNSKPDNYVRLISKTGLALLFVALSLWTVWTLLAANALGPVVDTALDENDGECVVGCSLRDAIQLVGSGDTITFAADYSIYLNSTLQITRSLIIDGSGHTITISGDTGYDGSRNVQVFNIGAGSAVTLNYLNVVSGTASNGAGICNNGSLIVNYSTIRDNDTAGNDGGGIYNGAALVVNHSTIRNDQGRDGGGIYGEGVIGNTTIINDSAIYNNTATRYGGGVHNNGGNAQLTLTNSTLSGNHANTLGGGFADGQNALTTIQFSTIAGNTAPSGGSGLDLYRSTTNIGATIIAYNTGSPNNVATYQATLNSLGYNLEDRNDAGFSATGDQTNTNPLLLPLADYDGDTQSHLPQAFSPAIDAISLAISRGAPSGAILSRRACTSITGGNSGVNLALRTTLPKRAVTPHRLVWRISGISISRLQAEATHREATSSAMCSSGHAGCSFVIAQSPEPLLPVEVDVLDSTNKPPLASPQQQQLLMPGG